MPCQDDPLGADDPDGSGLAALTNNPGQGEVCFELGVEDIILPAIGAHSYSAHPGANGPIVVPLTPPDENRVSGGCAEVSDNVVVKIIHNHEGFVVNTTDFASGAIRGQLPNGRSRVRSSAGVRVEDLGDERTYPLRSQTAEFEHFEGSLAILSGTYVLGLYSPASVSVWFGKGKALGASVRFWPQVLSYKEAIFLESHEARIGTLVRVLDGARRAGKGRFGTIETTYGHPTYLALDVRFEDGSVELYWYHELERSKVSSLA